MSSWISVGIVEKSESWDNITISVPLPRMAALWERSHCVRAGWSRCAYS